MESQSGLQMLRPRIYGAYRAPAGPKRSTCTRMTCRRHPASRCARRARASKLMRDWIDPSVIDEHDPLSADPALDMYDARHRVPYSAEFLARFSAAQQARLDRLESWALERLRLLRSTPDGWMKAGGRRIRNVDIVGGNHYLAGQPELVPRVADAIAEWANAP
jgi:hypothetical protein